MKKILIVLLAAITALTFCVPAFASEADTAKSYYPVVGSWMLSQVYEIRDGQEPVLLEKEENQSLYGSGKGVYTFDEDGYAHYIMFDAGDIADVAAEWKTTSPNVYIYTEEDGPSETFTYNEEEDTLHRSFAEADRTLDFVYNRAIVGSWKLDTVFEIHPGDAPEELDPEGNQSLFSAAENIVTFNADGTATEEVKDGPNEFEEAGTWEMTEPDKYMCTQNGLAIELDYFRVDDTLFRDVIDNSPDAAHPYLRFIYARYEAPEAEEDVKEEAEAPAQPVQPAQDNSPRKTGRTMDLSHPEGGGLIVTLYELTDGSWVDANGMGYTKASETEWFAADGSKWVTGEYFNYNPIGRVFTGFGMYLYDEYTGNVIYVDLLSDGRYVNQNTGVFYEQEGGGGDHFYGDDGSVWVDEWYYKTQIDVVPDNNYKEDELINGGQIFTGNQLYLYDPNTGNGVLVSELSQGGWANENTGVIYTQEGGGGDHFYGDDSSVLVTEWYYMTYIASSPEPYEEEELINGGQIFTGNQLTLYDPDTGNPVTVSELSQGGWANEYTGVIYTQEGGGGDHFYGSDGSVLVTEWYYYNYIAYSPEPSYEEDELINGGQIFTGHQMTLYDMDTGNAVIVSELSQGGWANEANGVIYEQEGGGGDHFYGNDGSVLVSEWYYFNN